MAGRRRARPGVEAMEGRALLSAGDLDLTFAGTGIVTTPSGGTAYYSSVTDVAVQADGKAVEVGTRSYTSKGSTRGGAVVVRYNANGSLDTSFGTSGRVNLDVDSGLLYPGVDKTHPWSVAIQADGKILVAGQGFVDYGKGASAYRRLELYVTRLNANGTVDKTFNQTGVARFGLGLGQINVNAVGLAIQADGRIVIGGGADNTGNRGFLVARFLPSGQLDATFGPGGQGYNFRTNGVAASMTLDASGRILMGGRSDDSGPGGNPLGAVVRYTANGLVDTTFDGDGEVDLAYLAPHGLAGIGVQSGGQIVVAGSMRVVDATYYQLGVARLNGQDGSVDTTFGNAGYAFDPAAWIATDLAVQADDKILVTGGRTTDPFEGESDKVFLTERFLADGSGLDPAFADAGRLVTSFGPDTKLAFAFSVAVAPGNKFLVAGRQTIQSTGENRFATARYLNDVGVASSSTAASLAGPMTLTKEVATPLRPIPVESAAPMTTPAAPWGKVAPRRKR